MADNNQWTLGETSRRYETGGRGAGTISTGRGDNGGVSYGSYQLSSRAGTLREYLNQSEYRDQFAGMAPNSPEFNEKWRELARTEPQFAQDQHDFIKRSHYDPQVDRLKDRGIDLSDRGPAVHDALWSTSVQFRALTPRIFEKGLQEKFGENYDLTKLSDKDIVEAVQDYKINHNEQLFSKSPRLWDALENRAQNEKTDLVRLAEQDRTQQQGQPGQNAPDNTGQQPARAPHGTDNGASSVEIRQLQERLSHLGYTDAQGQPLEADGKLGQKTEEAIKAFQRDHDLKVDGIAGPRTLEALKTAEPSKPHQDGAAPPSTAQDPLLSDPGHPDHAMYKQALNGIEKLGAAAGFKDQAERERAAAALTFEAKASGLKQIDSVAQNTTGTGLFAVEGALDDPANKRAYVEKGVAVQQPVEKSSELLRQGQELPQQPGPEPVPATPSPRPLSA
ncbi:peptidoglycan-binding domain-containing protein [Lysobacter capsici]|uniref:peptidoglycan-binding domain-containing protein n=1 Tax=Lysobacter capsici TaxID=435897 RepID=UPI001C006948|nr:peptidoglycan-binding domain-containing protein [Lysobacter capsici]QWF19506.1 peptidoglycan-binding protein [Lysobacter capsici]